jgi:hypothetical protein
VVARIMNLQAMRYENPSKTRYLWRP